MAVSAQPLGSGSAGTMGMSTGGAGTMGTSAGGGGTSGAGRAGRGDPTEEADCGILPLAYMARMVLGDGSDKLVFGGVPEGSSCMTSTGKVSLISIPYGKVSMIK